MSDKRMPAVFVGHGSPLTAFEDDNPYVAGWRALGERLPRPKAILAISAHWQAPTTAVTAMAAPRTIHDFYGFPEALYQYHYQAPGSPELAARAVELVGPGRAAPSNRWGLDHGSWSVLMHVFPHADVPVVQMALNANLDAAGHYEVGKALAPLRDEGVLVMGTGNIVHNLRLYNRDPEEAPNPQAEGFRQAVQARLDAHDHPGLIETLDHDPRARLAAPTPEHIMPLVYVAALQRPEETPAYFSAVTVGAGLDMTSVVFDS